MISGAKRGRFRAIYHADAAPPQWRCFRGNRSEHRSPAGIPCGDCGVPRGEAEEQSRRSRATPAFRAAETSVHMKAQSAEGAKTASGGPRPPSGAMTSFFSLTPDPGRAGSLGTARIHGGCNRNRSRCRAGSDRSAGFVAFGASRLRANSVFGRPGCGGRRSSVTLLPCVSAWNAVSWRRVGAHGGAIAPAARRQCRPRPRGPRGWPRR